MTGTLYGVGVGPGDPELLTRKACRVLGAAPVVAYPAPAGGLSMARGIVEGLLAPGVEEIAYPLPMRRDRAPGQDAYDAAAARLGPHLAAGRDVAVLCEGDPMFYGSFMYLAERLGGAAPVSVVPGVTSISAATAAAGIALVARNARLQVLPAPLGDAELAERIAAAETTVLMKVGAHMGRVRALIEALGLAGRSVYVAYASGPAEAVLALADAPDPAPYFSMILIRRESDPWLT